MLRLMIPHDFDYSSANLRDKIQYWLHKKGWKHADLSLATGIDKATLSSLMNEARQFNIEHLDKLTRALDLEEGALYPDFLKECYDDKKKLKVAKSEKFLLKVVNAENGQLLNDVINSLIEQSSKNITVVFKVAEELYSNKMYFDSVPLYKATTRTVKNRLDSKLSMSYYRLFMCSRRNLVTSQAHINDCKDSLLLLLDHIELLPVEHKLEAYIEVAVFYHLMEDSQNTIKYSERLLELTTDLLENISKNKLDEKMLQDYYHEALLYKGFALKAMGSYQEAFKIIDSYSSYNDKYGGYAAGNKHLVNVLMGGWDHIDKYLAFSLSEKKKLTILPVVLEASIKHNNLKLINEFITENEDSLLALANDDSLLGKKHRMKAYYYLGAYYVQIGQLHTGIDYILETMKLANFFQNQSRIKDCWKLFAKYSESASKQQRDLFNEIITNSL